MSWRKNMRTKFITYSKELNDAFLEAYSHYTYLLGYDDYYGATTYSGLYDILEREVQFNNEEYIILRNDYIPDEYLTSIPRNLDSIHYKIKKLGRQ